MSISARIEIPEFLKLDDKHSCPLKLELDLTQAHDVAVQLEEQGFGYGAV